LSAKSAKSLIHTYLDPTAFPIGSLMWNRIFHAKETFYFWKVLPLRKIVPEWCI
jgi:hypothetical protein